MNNLRHTLSRSLALASAHSARTTANLQRGLVSVAQAKTQAPDAKSESPSQSPDVTNSVTRAAYLAEHPDLKIKNSSNSFQETTLSDYAYVASRPSKGRNGSWEKLFF